MDDRFLKWIKMGKYGANARERLANYPGYKIWTSNTKKNNSDGIQYFNRPPQDVWSGNLRDGIGSGCNSGFGALNLAVLLGASPIYLLGYDMKGGDDGKQSWFHDGHPSVQDNKVYKRFLDQFSGNLQNIKSSNARIVNLNPSSNLKCFEFSDSWPIEDKPVFVSYYTENTGYEEEAKRLRASCYRLGLKHDIKPVPNLGSWEKNTSYKPTFIKQMLKKHEGQKVVYVDADAEFVDFPDFFKNIDAEKHEIAAHYREWPNRLENKELLSGTIWFSNSDKCKKVVDIWEKHCEMKPDMWDQRALQHVINNIQSCDSLGVFDLPASYCAIFDQNMSSKPVILHHQASRRLKRAVAI
jgi:hypothetical protein